MVAAPAVKAQPKPQPNNTARSTIVKEADTVSAFYLSKSLKAPILGRLASNSPHKRIAAALLPKTAFWAVAWDKHRCIPHGPEFLADTVQ